jgi:signal transduction histidine kinase/CheY-like chemotaxis protein
MAVLETIGVGPLHYFQGLPIGIWFVLLECSLMGVVPVATVLSSLQGALVELQEHRHHLEDQVQRRTAELVEARDQAERASRAKTTFLASMSHELRTPLNAILGFSAIVRTDGGLSDEHRKDLEIVGNSGEHLLALIDDILDTAKIETGSVVVESEGFNLHVLVNDAVNMMRERARAKNLELTLDLSPSAPRCVRSDPGKLRQVLVNLVGNAVKYTDEGRVAVRLDAKPADGCSQVLLLLDVEDTGIGIALQDQSRIFDPFVQAGTRTRQGVGLGLAICRNVVQVLGGIIQLESQPGRGTRFHVEVPAEAVDPSELRSQALYGEQVIGLQPGQPEYRILIVEDQKENRLLLDRLLRAAGFQVRGAEDGLQAVEAFRVWRPHFIWMDLGLPILGGLEAAKSIRAMESGSEVKIVAVTASAFASEREQVLAAGLDDLLRKPYRPREIFECMSRHLGVRYLHDAMPQIAAGEPRVAMRPEDLASLPAEQLEELEQAVVSLDPERIARIVHQISDRNASLGAVLKRLVDSFVYTPIFTTLQSCRRTTTQTGQ